ncbi:MAG: hypothetical protein ABIR30_12475 [Chitinophagaceae bacterium]
MRGYYLLFFLIVYSCHITAQEIKAGELLRMQCRSDSNQHYSLYLPKNYQSGKKYPVVIFLDPAARGRFPVEKYRSVADEQELVLAGSSESKNFDAGSSAGSVTAIITDLVKSINTDESRIWLAGFSGGARMASSYAVANSTIAGVIACGAGFAGEDFYNSSRNIAFAGLVGYRDMNFEELLGIKDELTAKNKANLLLIFNGGHEWPPEDQLSLALLWLNKESSLMVMNKLQSDPAYFLRQTNEAKKAGLHYLSLLQANELRKIPALSAIADSLISNAGPAKTIAKGKKSFDISLNEERGSMDQLSFLFGQFVLSGSDKPGNDDLWKQEAQHINSLRTVKNKYSQLSGERLFDFSWRICIEQYYWLMGSKQYKQAYKAAYVLSFFTPTGLDPDYLMSRAAAGLADRSLCLHHLGLSVKKKTTLKETILNDDLIMAVIGREEAEKLFGD